MKILLTIFALIFSSLAVADEIEIIKLNDGANDYEAEAIAKTLSNRMTDDFYIHIQESLVNGYGSPPHSIKFNIHFAANSIDLNNDGKKEVVVWYDAPGFCGSGGCAMFIIGKDEKENWFIMTEVFGGWFEISNEVINSYLVLYHKTKYGSENKCIVNENKKYICEEEDQL